MFKTQILIFGQFIESKGTKYTTLSLGDQSTLQTTGGGMTFIKAKQSPPFLFTPTLRAYTPTPISAYPHHYPHSWALHFLCVFVYLRPIPFGFGHPSFYIDEPLKQYSAKQSMKLSLNVIHAISLELDISNIGTFTN